jgi:hypothetical protein
MTPADRNLKDLQPSARRQKKEFWIESEAVNRHLLEHRLNPATLEELEAALCVMDSQGQNHPDHDVENHSADFPSARLVLLDQRPIHGPGTDDDVGLVLFRGRQELFELIDWSGQIRIGEHHVVA